MMRTTTAFAFPTLCAVLLAACATVHDTPRLTLPPEVSSAPIVVVGEMHGTQEMPAAAGALVASLASTGNAIALGLEMPRDFDHQLEAYLASDGGPEARAAVTRGAFWQRSRQWQDGRASGAMLQLLDSMRRLRMSGANVRVIGFGPPERSAIRVPTGVDYERALAEGVTSQLRRGETMVVLVGNMHALKYPMTEPFPAKDKMAAFLPTSTVALVAWTRGGNHWGCAPSCGMTEMRGRYADATLDGRVEMRPTWGYDGILYVGPVTASEPAAAKD